MSTQGIDAASTLTLGVNTLQAVAELNKLKAASAAVRAEMAALAGSAGITPDATPVQKQLRAVNRAIQSEMSDMRNAVGKGITSLQDKAVLAIRSTDLVKPTRTKVKEITKAFEAGLNESAKSVSSALADFNTNLMKDWSKNRTLSGPSLIRQRIADETKQIKGLVAHQTKEVQKAFEQVSAPNSTKGSRSIGLMQRQFFPENQGLSDLNRMLRAIDAVSLAESNWAATSATRRAAAVAGLTQQSSELAMLNQRMKALEAVTAAEAKWAATSASRRASAVAALTSQGGDADFQALKRQYASGVSLFQTVDVDRYGQKLNEVKRPIVEVGSRTRELSEAHNALHSSIRGVSGALGGLWLTYGKYIPQMLAGFSAVMAAKASFQSGIEYDYQTTFTSALAEGRYTNKDVQREIDKIAVGQPVSKVEIAKSIRQMEAAGFDGLTAAPLVKTNIAASLMGEVDLKTATDDMVSMIEVFKLHSKDPLELIKNYQRVADVTALVSQTTTANFSDVAESFKRANGLAGTLNLTIEDMGAAVTVLGKAGIKGDKAGTYISQLVRDLYSPKSKEAGRLMDSLGFSAFDKATGEMRPFKEALLDLFKKVSQLAKPEQFSALKTLFETWGSKAALPIADDVESFVKSLEKLNTGAGGTTENFIDKLSESAKYSLDVMKSDIQNLFVDAFNGNEQAIKKMAAAISKFANDPSTREGMKKFVTALADTAAWLSDNTQLVLDLAKALTTLVVFQTASGAIRVFASLLGTMAGHFASLFGWAGKAAGGISALVGGMRAAAAVGGFSAAFALLTTRVKALWAAMTVSSGVTAGAAAASTLAGGLGKAGIAATALRVGMAALGGPIGMITGLVLSGITAWQMWGRSGQEEVAKVRESLYNARQDQRLDTIGRIKDVNSDIRKGEYLDAERKHADLERDLAEAKKRAGAAAVGFATAKSGSEEAEKYKKERRAELGFINTLEAQLKTLKPHADKARAKRIADEKEQLRLAKGAANAANTRTLPGDPVNASTVQKWEPEVKQYRDYLSIIDQVERRRLEAQKMLYDNGLMLESDYLLTRKQVRQEADKQADAELQKHVDAQNRLMEEAWDKLSKLDPRSKGYKDNKTRLENQVNQADAAIELAREQAAERATLRAAENQSDVFANLRAKYGEPDAGVKSSQESVEALKKEIEAQKSLTDVNRDSNLVKIESAIRNEEARLSAVWAAASSGELIDITADEIKVMEDRISMLRRTAEEYARLKTEQEALDNDWRLGANKAFEEYSRNAEKSGKRAYDAFTKSAQGMEDAIVEFARTGKLSMSNLVDDILADILRLQVKQNIVTPIMGVLNNGIQSSGGSGGGLLGSAIGWLADLLPFAQGGAFTSGTGLSSYRNTVVSQPTLFAFANGAGIMGEEPGSPGEAIMPLTRTRDGDLGVKVQGAGGGGGNVTVNVIESPGNGGQVRESSDGNGNRMIEVLVEKVKGSIMNDVARGGTPMSSSLERTYGLSRSAGGMR